MDSFLCMLVQGILQLEIGVSAFDSIAQVSFQLHFYFIIISNLILQVLSELHAYLIVVFGDIPAIFMIMWMKGHNAICPCHMCNIQGVRIPSSSTTTYYVPLNCEHFLMHQMTTIPALFLLEIMKLLLNKQLKFRLPQPVQPLSDLPLSMG